MPIPVEQRVNFFVFVIESPSAIDIYHRRGEGDIIQQAVQLNSIPCSVKTAISRQAFEASLKVGLPEAMSVYPGFIPLIHISAHGFSEGIELSSGEVITWIQLKDLFRPINTALNGSLVVCMSSCEGYAGVRMAMHIEDSDLPFLALIGCAGKPSWADTVVAFTTLYHQLYRGEHISAAVDAMRIASGNSLFIVEHAENTRRAYLEHIRSCNPSQAQEKLDKLLNKEEPEQLDRLKTLAE